MWAVMGTQPQTGHPPPSERNNMVGTLPSLLKRCTLNLERAAAGLCVLSVPLDMWLHENLSPWDAHTCRVLSSDSANGLGPA
jgi:hypothetical protein